MTVLEAITADSLAAWIDVKAELVSDHELADLLREASRRLTEGAPWQPIATAIKERGKSILVFCGERRNIYTACWWSDDGGETYGWFLFGGKSIPITDPPTHWMPLPAPPNP